MTHPIMTKVPEYPNPHEFDVNWDVSSEPAAANNTTIIPIIVYDEGLGTISARKTHPQNASFGEYPGPNCFPTSKINRIFCQLEASFTKGAIETDKIQALKFSTMLIHTSFMDGQLAEDEVSGLDLNEILELQNESTDRQTGPLYNTVDMSDGKTNAHLDMGAAQDFLDTDLELEGVAFSEDDYYDCLNYYTNGEKLKTIQTGMQWHTLDRQHTHKTMRFQQQSNTKFMNPYTFLGLMVHVPQIQTLSQIGKAGETTAIGHINFTLKFRYLEFNHEFNHAMI